MTETMTWRAPIAATSDLAVDPYRADATALRTLADLLSLADLANELSEQAFRQLAARPTVTAHLGHAREHLTELRRTLGKVEAMLAFNSGYRGTW
jgi:hypothetical protein